MSDYLADELLISEQEFTRRACDPRASVVVEACAGSGKTWLLVSRIIRQLLAGSAPGEILAITFTRRAAQEMHARLMEDLKHLARASDAEIAELLSLRGMPEEGALQAVDLARGLYESVVTARAALTIETFHGWFWHLLTRAPLGCGIPFAPVLLEATDRLRWDAWLQFSAALTRTEHAGERAAWEWLIDHHGDHTARQLLLAFLDKRAEWWSFAGDDEDAAVERALQPLRAGSDADALLRVREADFVAAVQGLVDLWCSSSKFSTTVVRFCADAQRWLAQVDPEPQRDFRTLCAALFTKEGTDRVLLRPDKILSKLDPAQTRRYADLHRFVVERLLELTEAHRTYQALRMNEAALACGRLLLATYQRLKARQQALDFTDLEWHAHRLLADADHSAYMQCRLDARYRHVLLDEFQDTNPLQWQILQSWLAAYGPLETAGDTGSERPTVFVVGDPKQSIYRFRRADPRVFDAAQELLRHDFAAVYLRTNVTRRNPTAVVDVLNRALPGGNPLYQPQSTRAAARGEFILLPLAQPQAPSPKETEGGGALRDVLLEPRVETESDVHYREGCALANELAYRIGQTRVAERDGRGQVTERQARWSDALILVRQRTHLVDYERALRDAGVPFVSDRRGGLLTTLEADDLAALLGFLAAPYADLQLAHALRSPILDCADVDLIQLASAPGDGWWQRLLALGASASPVLAAARNLLTRWLALAGVLPVHDLLDRIYFESDLRRRYAGKVPAALHAQVQANLDAFIELALALDAGRYPSLPRFIDEVSRMKRQAADEAPDEGAADGADAVRIMTIHGAKGLEAEVVALADAHQRPTAAQGSVLVVWPPQQAAPQHLSLVGGGVRDAARADWFLEESMQCAQEDWNLLYVACTRARQVLIVSGSAPANGSPDDSWYARLQCAQDLSLTPAKPQPVVAPSAARSVRDFLPAALPTGIRASAPADSEAMRLGRAWHALLELGEASLARVVRSHGLDPGERDRVAAAAASVRRRLPQFFAGAGEPELDLVASDGVLLRVDRVVELADAIWILDFKWRVTATERAPYETQVRHYAQVLSSIRPDKPVKLALVLANGELIEVSAES